MWAYTLQTTAPLLSGVNYLVISFVCHYSLPVEFRDNVVDSSFYAGIFVEAGAKPNIVSNIFHGGDSGTLKSSLTQVKTLPSQEIFINSNFHEFRSTEVWVFCSSSPPKVCLAKTSLRTSP